MSAASPFDELAHRVNNLLGTVELQVEVARADGTLAAHATALTHILESARRVRDDLQRLRAAGRERAPGVPPDAHA